MRDDNWFLLMRVLSIAGQHIVDVCGLFKGQRHNTRGFLCMGGGKWQYSYFYSLLISCFRFSVLLALSLEDRFIHCEVVEGSFCSDTFVLFIQNLLEHMQPFPLSNSVVDI